MTAHFLSPEALRQIMDANLLTSEAWDAAMAEQADADRAPGARVDPPARFDVTLPPGMEATREQEANRREWQTMPDLFAEAIASLNEAILTTGSGYVSMETTTSFDPASDSVAMRISSRPRVVNADEVAAAWRSGAFSSRHWLNRRVYDETSAEVERYGYARGGVRWQSLPPEGDNLLVSPAFRWFDEMTSRADSGVACDRESGDGCDCSECRTRHAEIEASAAVWLEILARETEISASPLEAARRVFGSDPPL